MGCPDSQTVQQQTIIPESTHHTATTGQLPNGGSMPVHNADSLVAYVPEINTMLGWFFVAHATDTMYVNSTLVYRRPV